MIVYLSLYSLLLLISAVISGCLAAYVWRHRAAPGGLSFSLLMAATAEWALFNGIEIAMNGSWIDYACNAILYVGVVAVAPLWLTFALEYSGRGGWLTWKRKALLWVVPVVSLALVATDPWHGLVWSGIVPVSDALGSRLIYEHGIVDWIIMAYSYVLMGIGSAALMTAAARAPRPYRSQVWTLLLGVAVPWLGSVVYFADITPFHGVDFTPLALNVTGLIFTWGIFRQGLFDIVPIARETLLARMADGVLVLDGRHRVLDINPVARRLIGATGRMIGLPAEAVIVIWPDLKRYCEGHRSASAEIKLEGGPDPLWLEVQVSPLESREGHQDGMLVVLRDTSERKRAEVALRLACDELIRANEALQAEIGERKRAEEQIRASLREKEALLKEIHHRVKNNLQVINSLLSLQSGSMSPGSAAAFKESQNRIRSMALVHEKLYSSRDLSRVDFGEYVKSLTGDLKRSYVTDQTVDIVIDIAEVSLDIDAAIPCGLIVNELVSNSLMYAFGDGRKGTIRVALARKSDTYTMVIGDDGAGLPPDIDYRNTSSLGMQLVNSLVSQIEGSIELEDMPGTTFKITFREIDNRYSS